LSSAFSKRFRALSKTGSDAIDELSNCFGGCNVHKVKDEEFWNETFNLLVMEWKPQMAVGGSSRIGPVVIILVSYIAAFGCRIVGQSFRALAAIISLVTQIAVAHPSELGIAFSMCSTVSRTIDKAFRTIHNKKKNKKKV